MARRGSLSVPERLIRGPLFCALVLCGLPSGLGQKMVTAKPLQTHLLGPVDGVHTRVGMRVLARVMEPWSGNGCELRVGALVEGHVSEIERRSETNRRSAVHIVFESADCSRHLASEFPMTIVAMVGPENGPAEEEQWRRDGPPLSNVTARVDGGPASATGTAESKQYFSQQSEGVAEAHSIVTKDKRKLPAALAIGQVLDIPNMRLAVGAGVDGGSIVWAMNKDARLEARTTLMMLPTPHGNPAPATERASNAPERAGTADAVATIAVAAAPPPDPADEAEICAGGCNHLLATGMGAARVTTRLASVPIGYLGFAPHEKEMAVSFNHETDLVYLDEHHLLCTFDPHRLRTRAKDDAETVRTIRALLIDPATHEISHMVEWKVRGDDAYLWRVGAGKVLVHVGHELRLYDAELHVVKAINVDAPVEWVVSSPSSDHLVVAVRKERYSEEVMRTLQNLRAEADIDLDVRLYDGALNLLSESIRSSTGATPVLSDGGELRLMHLNHDHWRIVEFGWNQGQRTLATLRTSCRPLISAPAHGLMFVLGCMVSSNRTWYRMMREDGRPLLKAESAADEIAQTAEAALTGEFAVRVMKTTQPVTLGEPFNPLALTKEEIGIYRSSDGAKLESVVTDDFILAQNSYALSPAGDQMAVVGRDSILFYPVKLRP